MIAFTDLATGFIQGSDVVTANRTVADLADYWKDREALKSMDVSVLLYTTQTWMTCPEGTEGAVLWGNTTLMPGKVGSEFFMTRGHRHTDPTRGELCVTVSGQGNLLLMDANRQTRSEPMTHGSTHWIDGALAHRVVNTGPEPLTFLCAWPADCGHEYAEILQLGFTEPKA